MFVTNRNLGIFSILIITFLVYDIFIGINFLSAIGIGLFFMISFKFILDIGNIIEMRDFVALIAVTQWVYGPYMAYNILPESELYYMAVTETEYMSYVIPGVLFMIIGLYLPIAPDNKRLITGEHLNKIKVFISQNRYLGYILIVAGFALSTLNSYLPASLGFFVFLLANMRFVGVFLILFDEKSKIKWPVFTGVLGLFALDSISMGMFSQLITWLLFTFLVISYILRLSLFTKITTFTIGFLLVLLLQSVKDEYRKATWYAEDSRSNTEIFQDMALKRVSNPSMLFEDEVTNNFGARLNQGWIIARILGHMPENEPFCEGETIKDGIVAGIFPRFLMPGKAMAGGQATFTRFTGTPLAEGTSMGLSLIGEAYANYGYYGGIFFMFIISLFYNWLIVYIIKLSDNNPTLLLWIPLLFFQAVKAETDFATVFNHITKSSLVIWGLFYGWKKILHQNM